VNLPEKLDTVCCTTTAFTAAELMSQLQMVSHSYAIAPKSTAASTATMWFSSCTVAYRCTHAGNDAHLLWSQRSSSLSCQIVVTSFSPIFSACYKHLCGQTTATLCRQLLTLTAVCMLLCCRCSGILLKTACHCALQLQQHKAADICQYA